MSQSLRAVKRFRLRELIVASPKARTLPAAAVGSAPNRPQRPLATPLAAAPTDQPSSSSSRSGSDDTPTIAGAAGAVLDNPFVPHKNPKSGRWAPPKYSLRRQADLIKHARKSGALHLLPPGPKLSEAQLQLQLQLLASATSTTTTTTPLAPPFALSVAAEKEQEQEVRRNGLVGVRMGREEEETRETRRGEDGPASAASAAAAADDATDAAAAAWTRSVEWVGTVRERNVEGADVGNRLYAGKKRMFKGHKWERERERRVARTKMLLRDMDKRVQRFKGVRCSLLFFLFLFLFLSRTQLLFLVFFYF